MLRLHSWTRNINIDGEIRTGEPLAAHTTFRVGGPADLYARPRSASDLSALLAAARSEGVPWFVLGGGSNILVSDAGVRGLVIDLAELDECRVEERRLVAGAGLEMSEASAYAADHDLAGLDFIYAMPGSVGGAVWMNARCYDGEIFDVLGEVEVVQADGAIASYTPRPEDFGYKRSPFMAWDAVMTRVTFTLRPGAQDELWVKMRAHEEDRRAKGHFAFPCAGSVFKNNRAFGKPSGAIIDSIGMRGFAIGGAKVSDLHANIIVNTGGATGADIRRVIEHVEAAVAHEIGLRLEREVLYVGDWSGYEHE